MIERNTHHQTGRFVKRNFIVLLFLFVNASGNFRNRLVYFFVLLYSSLTGL